MPTSPVVAELAELVRTLETLAQLARHQDAQIRALGSALAGTRTELAQLRQDHNTLAMSAAQGAQLSRGLDSLGQALTEHARAAVTVRDSVPVPIVNVTVPARKTEGTVIRDALGRIVSTTTVEKDIT